MVSSQLAVHFVYSQTGKCTRGLLCIRGEYSVGNIPVVYSTAGRIVWMSSLKLGMEEISFWSSYFPECQIFFVLLSGLWNILVVYSSAPGIFWWSTLQLIQYSCALLSIGEYSVSTLQLVEYSSVVVPSQAGWNISLVYSPRGEIFRWSTLHLMEVLVVYSPADGIFWWSTVLTSW
jgi:hypothetical protein